MKNIKSLKEFEKEKEKIVNELGNFIKNYDRFLNSVSPRDWKHSYFSKLEELKEIIRDFKPMVMKDMEDEWIRKQVLTSEEQELYDKTIKYNL